MRFLRFLMLWVGIPAALILLIGGCRISSSHDDLPEILKKGELRVLVRPGFGESGMPLGQEGIDEKKFVQRFAERLGLRVQWIEVRRHDAILSDLRKGRGDLALRRFSPEILSAENGVVSSATIDWVDDLLVATEDGPIVGEEDLPGRTLQIPGCFLPGLKGWLPEGVRTQVIPEDIPLEKILERVSRGRYPLTVTDSGLLGLMRRRGCQLRRIKGPVHRRRLVWALRKQSHQLQRGLADFVFAEKMLENPDTERACRNFEEIRSSRVLRVLMRNSPVGVSIERGGLTGFEYELVSIFARENGLRVEPVIPPRGKNLLTRLEAGYGDLACPHEPAPLEGAGALLFSRTYRYVDLVSVIAARTVPLGSVEDLAGLPVAASEAVAQYCRVMPLEPPIDVDDVPGRDALESLSEVARGSVYAAVVDEDTAKMELYQRKSLVSGVVMLPKSALCWFANPEAQDLMQRIDRFLKRSRKNGVIRQLEQKHFGPRRKRRYGNIPSIPEGDLSPFDEMLRWAGKRNHIDWRLLASLMYEESRFDPDAVGPGGSAGLFQMMPATWEELGVEDPLNPGEAIEAGSRYLSSLTAYFNDLELFDRMAMAIASYNVGPRHVFDARALARNMGLDPDRWLGNVETALLLLDDPDVARRYPAGVCRCRRAVGYTRRILRRYTTYRAAFPPS